MKKAGLFLGLAVSLFMVSTPLVHSQNVAVKNTHYVIDFQKLSHYLELEDFQKAEVYQINSFFIDQQKEYLTKNISPKSLEKKWNQVLYSNLKMMKDALTEAQYKKYLRLLNITHSNRMLAALAEPDDIEAELLALLRFQPDFTLAQLEINDAELHLLMEPK